MGALEASQFHRGMVLYPDGNKKAWGELFINRWLPEALGNFLKR